MMLSPTRTISLAAPWFRFVATVVMFALFVAAVEMSLATGERVVMSEATGERAVILLVIPEIALRDWMSVSWTVTP